MKGWRLALGAGLAVLIAALDQLSKYWVLEIVQPTPYGVPLTPWLNIVLVGNKGVTFGLFRSVDQRLLLIAVAAVILFLLMRWLLRTHSGLVAGGLGLVMGGAIGNVVDRIRFGAVVDFLDFYYASYHWYAFNLADAAIVTGVGLLLADSMVKAR